MRLLLWDCDDRSYSYHIETSLNNREWQMAVNKDRELCRSWQNIVLDEPRPVVFVRIVGVHNTANEVFHCVHFECPSLEVLATESDDKEGERDEAAVAVAVAVAVEDNTDGEEAGAVEKKAITKRGRNGAASPSPNASPRASVSSSNQGRSSQAASSPARRPAV